MNDAVREATPIEVLSRDIEKIFSTPYTVEETKSRVRAVIEKAKCCEQEYLKRQYVIIEGHCKSLVRENDVLKVQNRVLAEYILFNEENFKGRA